MICDTAEEFAAALPKFGAIAGLDLGTKTIGVAVSDSLRQVASPITVIPPLCPSARSFAASEAAACPAPRITMFIFCPRWSACAPQPIVGPTTMQFTEKRTCPFPKATSCPQASC